MLRRGSTYIHIIDHYKEEPNRANNHPPKFSDPNIDFLMVIDGPKVALVYCHELVPV